MCGFDSIGGFMWLGTDHVGHCVDRIFHSFTNVPVSCPEFMLTSEQRTGSSNMWNWSESVKSAHVQENPFYFELWDITTDRLRLVDFKYQVPKIQ